MTFAEALVYAAAFARRANRDDAYNAVEHLRGSSPPSSGFAEWELIVAMENEFKTFIPTVRAQPPSLMDTLFK